jgi:hypothetical protein
MWCLPSPKEMEAFTGEDIWFFGNIDSTGDTGFDCRSSGSFASAESLVDEMTALKIIRLFISQANMKAKAE